ncbi:MAG: phosphoadenosine phosphosulfate reductase family protein [Lachnospiraceae bacterium]|nr:phosphoadenosine phosphosulfate reductase family protein [Lachnospiraceae bacterium]
MSTDKCTKKSCQHKTIVTTTIYWCDECKVPIFDKQCNCCGKEGKYLATDIRPVFPEEKLLIGIILKPSNIFEYNNSSIWYGGNYYFIDGKKNELSFTKLNMLPDDEIVKIKNIYDSNVNNIEYSYFNEMIDKFVAANSERYNYIENEAIDFIKGYANKYSLNDMFVSFSGGKDSTVTSHIVRKALCTNKILHIFGDTTLEFDLTYKYKERFVKEEGIRVLTAKNREKDFEELCKIVGPPSRVMRWCCTVFKTGAISKTILSAFKNQSNILTFYGIRKNESASRSKYERESDSPKITKQTVVSPIIEWIDFDVWLYILTNKIDFNDAYRLGFARVGCWCCPNNSSRSEFLSKVYMYERYTKWHKLLLDFAKGIGKPDAEVYVNTGKWKARQGGNGLEISKKTVVAFEPCATEENAFNYELQREITEELYELFKPFGRINKELGNKRLGEVYVIDLKGNVALVLQGRIGTNRLKVIIKNKKIAHSNSLDAAEKKIQCQLTKYQLCMGCKACESICKFDAIKIKSIGDKTTYTIDDNKCKRCTECVGHFNAGCYMRKVIMTKRGN